MTDILDNDPRWISKDISEDLNFSEDVVLWRQESIETTEGSTFEGAV